MGFIAYCTILGTLKNPFDLFCLFGLLLLPAMAVTSKWKMLSLAGCSTPSSGMQDAISDAPHAIWRGLFVSRVNWIFSFTVVLHMKFLSQKLDLAVAEMWQESRENLQPIPVQAMNEATVGACTLENTSTQAFYPSCHPIHPWSGCVCLMTHCLDCGTRWAVKNIPILAILFH